MNKTELIQAVVAETGLGREQVAAVVEAVFGRIIPAEVQAGRSVAIRGFGTFEAVSLGARLMRHPQSGEVLTVPARRKLVLRAARVRS